MPPATTLAIRDGEVAREPDPGARHIDLRGACVIPGLADAHVHFPTWSLAQHQVRLEDARSLGEALDRVAGGLAAVPPGAWLRGVGWRDGDWTEAPTRAALDRVAGETPVALFSKDYHSLWLNGAGLARASGELDTPGGVVVRDERGEPAACSGRPPPGAFATATCARRWPRWSRRCAAAFASQPRAGSPPCTTRTAGWAPSRSSGGCTSAAS